ncbi:hypothetical protein HOO54_11670 [Bacillus sp. WMMC1349]|uniref:hypothetical protein n=1 Tax=Bacillus sp. WMMC1349 TaxID=2736254 RepID=UPI0015525547|nr:hypothetical protein [Bacillus sp. WMMC1349]NPC92869.1 hypothetical protein [Bacillus sp. WMMC1349]
MNIIKKIDEKKCSIEDLRNFLDEKNPIVLYHAMTYIGKKGYDTGDIKAKLTQLSSKRKTENKLLGLYKIGDLAIATLKKLGVQEDEISRYQHLDDFDKETVKRLFEEINW